MVDENDRRWHYGSIGRNGDSFNFRVLEEMPEGVHDRIVDATKLLNGAGPTSSFAALADQFRLFDETFGEVEADIATSLQQPGLNARLGSAVDNVLFAFRAFLDRTAHQLSLQYGKRSPELASFKAAQKEQFDRVIEYRFSYKLRNMSQHVGQVISTVRSKGERDDTGEMNIVMFEVVMHPARLLEVYDEWGPVRADLAAMEDDIHVRELIAGLESSCQLLMAHVLVAQEPNLRGAISTINNAVLKCELGPDDSPLAVRWSPSEIEATPGRVKPSFQAIPVEVAAQVESNLDKARAMLSEDLGWIAASGIFRP